MPSNALRLLAAQHNGQSSRARLLRLPPEIRNRIYSLLMPEPTHYENLTRWLADGTCWLPYNQKPFCEPPILQVCQQTRNEALQMFVQRHTFTYGDTRFTDTGLQRHGIELEKWLGRLSLAGGRFVRQLEIVKDVEINLHNWYGSEEIGKAIPRARAWMKIDFDKDGNLATRILSIRMVDPVFDLRKREILLAMAEEAQKWHNLVKDVLKDGAKKERITVALETKVYWTLEGIEWEFRDRD